MSLEFLARMAAQSKEKEGLPSGPGQRKSINGQQYNWNLQYEEEFCAIVFEVLRDGGSLDSAATAIGVGRKTLQRYREQFPDFDTACEAGLSASVHAWEGIGRDNLLSKDFNSVVWKHLLTSKYEVKDPSRVILNVDSSSNAAQVADMLEQLEKGKI